MRTLIIADEDARTRNLVRLIFTENMGYKVIAVSNGAEAVLTAKEIAPDIVLIDASLSNQNGHKVSREIKRDPSLKNTSVILLTSAFAAFDERKISGAYADDVIIKPFEPEEIIKKVESLINQSEKRGTELNQFGQTKEVSKNEVPSQFQSLDENVAGQKKPNYFEPFEDILQLLAENLKSFYEISKGHVKNFNVIRNLKGLETFLKTAPKARPFKIPSPHLGKRYYLAALVSLGIILPVTMLVVFTDTEEIKQKLEPDEPPTAAVGRNEITLKEEKVKVFQPEKEKVSVEPGKVEIKETKKEIPKPGELTKENLKRSEYVVKKGDSLWRIADRFNVSVKELKIANDLEGDRLNVGDPLVIPSGKRKQVLKRVVLRERVRTEGKSFQPKAVSEDFEDIRRKYMQGYMKDLKETRNELGMSDRGILGPQ